MSRALIEKARRLVAREAGTIRGPLEGRLRFALAFPGPYRLGMSSLGYQIVYGLLNSLAGTACERVFLPDLDDEREFIRSRTRLFTLESQTPVADFDVLAFSVSYELDYANVVKIIGLSGLPTFSADRDESHPLVIAGGPCATFNPEPLAEIVDAFAIGEAEDLIGELVQALLESAGADREALLARLAHVPGLYVPRFYTPRYNADGFFAGISARPPAPNRVRKRLTFDLDRCGNQSIVRTPDAEFSDMLLVEAIRGCGRQCRFCVSGYASLPPRPRRLGRPPDGSRLGLVGSVVFDHPDAAAICELLVDEGREFSVSSIRLETLTPDLARMMHRGGQRTVTIAPEAGTERLRRVINKPTTDQEILEAARIAAEAGFERLKLYFMVGLPCENPEDIDRIASLVRQIATQHSSLRLQVSASCFVPKPWTPFQWFGMAPQKELSGKLARLKKSLASEKRVDVSCESPGAALAQAWLARGDRRAGKALAVAADKGTGYARAAAETGIDMGFYAARPRHRDEVFPWDHIDLLVNKDYLWQEYTRALEEKITGPCVIGSCARCGVCRPPQRRSS